MAGPPVASSVSRMSRSASPARALAIALLLVLVWPVSPAPSAGSDGPPHAAAVIDVAAGGDLQAALDQSQPGDTIRLVAGADYTGGFPPPLKSAGGPIPIPTKPP